MKVFSDVSGYKRNSKARYLSIIDITPRNSLPDIKTRKILNKSNNGKQRNPSVTLSEKILYSSLVKCKVKSIFHLKRFVNMICKLRLLDFLGSETCLRFLSRKWEQLLHCLILSGSTNEANEVATFFIIFLSKCSLDLVLFSFYFCWFQKQITNIKSLPLFGARFWNSISTFSQTRQNKRQLSVYK